MWGRSDKNFFTSFPWSSLVLLVIGFVILLIDLSFIASYISILEDYMWFIDITKAIISIFLIAFGIYDVIIFLFNLAPMSRYDRHFEELKTQIADELRNKNQKIIAEFVSFRPWMSNEYFVRARTGLPKYFFPLYYVVISIQNNILIINEYRLNIYEKSYYISGYNVLPIRSIVSAGIIQDRILFNSNFGDSAATVYFLEFRTIGGNVRIPIFEEEITGRYGELKNMRDEMLLKTMSILKTIRSDLLSKVSE